MPLDADVFTDIATPDGKDGKGRAFDDQYQDLGIIRGLSVDHPEKAYDER